MNPNQHQSTSTKLSPSQNSRTRPYPNTQPLQSQACTQNSQASSTNAQGKISLRTNNSKKLYKQNTESAQQSETLSVLKQSKELQHKQTDLRKQKGQSVISMKSKNGNNKIQWKGQGYTNAGTSKIGQEKSIINNKTTHSFNQNVSQALSIMGNTSSILTSYDQKTRKTSSSGNNNQQSTKNRSNPVQQPTDQASNTLSAQYKGQNNNGQNNNKRNELYFGENESTKSINMTGEDLSSVEGSVKNTNSSSFYQNKLRGLNQKQFFTPNQQFNTCQNELHPDYNQQNSHQPYTHPQMSTQAYNMISLYNSTPMYVSEKASMLTSIRQEYQHPMPGGMNKNTLSNMRSNLSTANNTTNTSQQFCTPNTQQAPPRKTASYYMSKPVYQNQAIETQPSINKFNQHHSFNVVGNNNNNSYISSNGNGVKGKVESSKEIAIASQGLTVNYRPAFISHRPQEQFMSHRQHEQVNARSSLTVRNLQFGGGGQPQQRTKSHTKNYSTTELITNHLTVNQDSINQHGHLDSHPKPVLNYQNSAIFHQPVQTSQSQPLFSESSDSPLMNRNSFNIYENLIQTNMNNSGQKAYILDSIQEKDEFVKVFVRANKSNNKNDKAQAESAISNKHIQRHKQDPRSCIKNHKLHLISQSSMIKSVDANYSSNPSHYDHSHNANSINRGVSHNHATAPAFINLKYIKSPTNTQDKLQILDKGVKNYEKYLKMGHEPFNSPNHTINQLISQQRQKSTENMTRQQHKQQEYSINSSFKQNTKAQAHSVYSYNPKTMQQKVFYPNGQQQPSLKNKQLHNCPIQIYSSNKNFHQIFNHPQKQDDIFRKTIDSSMKPPNFVQKFNRDDGKPLQSLGAHQHWPKFHYEYELVQDKAPTIRVNQASVRFNSPEHKAMQCKTLTIDTLHLASPEYSPNKQTVFSPTEKSLQPAQKSHFLSEPESQQNKQSVRQKKSIKKMLVSQSKALHHNSEVFYNYNFKDLLKGQKEQNRPNSRTILQVITKNQLTKIFCSTFKIGQNQNGCDCIPKCFWVENWLQKIHRHPNLAKESLMKNIDNHSHTLNYSTDNIWKNFTNDQVVSFPDANLPRNMNLSHQQIQTFKQIQKDIPRTCSSHPTFKSERYRNFLRQLLIHFYYLDPQLGYVQGMNIIAAGITYHSKTVLQAIQVMDFVMNVLNYKKIYLNDMKKCKDLSAKTVQLVKHYCYDMYNYVTIQNEVDLEMFILGWYFSMMGTFVPLESMHFVINKFIQKQFEGLIKIIVAYFIFIKDILMEKTDPNQIMEELSVQKMIERSLKVDWNQLISVSGKLQITLEKDKF